MAPPQGAPPGPPGRRSRTGSEVRGQRSGGAACPAPRPAMGGAGGKRRERRKARKSRGRGAEVTSRRRVAVATIRGGAVTVGTGRGVRGGGTGTHRGATGTPGRARDTREPTGGQGTPRPTPEASGSPGGDGGTPGRPAGMPRSPGGPGPTPTSPHRGPALSPQWAWGAGEWGPPVPVPPSCRGGGGVREEGGWRTHTLHFKGFLGFGGADWRSRPHSPHGGL